MFYRIKFSILILVSVAASAQVNEQWVARFTSNGNNIDAAVDIVVDGSGNAYATGTSWGNNGNFDIVTIKYDAQGNELWVASFNGTGNGYDEGRAVAFDASGNVFAAGYTDKGSANYDYVLIKYDSQGNEQWVATYNGSGNGFDEVYDLAVDPIGNTFITGGSDAGASSDYVTVKYNSAGVQQWASSYNGPGNNIDAASAILLDGLGNVYVTGHSMGSSSDFDYATIKYNPSGVQQWEARYNGTGNLFDAASAIAMDANGKIIVTGYSYGSGSDNDYVTVKYDQSGNQLWAKRFNGTGNDYDKANAITVDMNNNVYVTGRCFGIGSGQDYATIKYSPAGVELWVNIYNGLVGNGYDEATDIVYDGADGIYITGASKNTGTNNDYVTIKYDTLGNQKWLISYNGPANDNDQSLAMDIDGIGNIFVTGKSKGTNSNTDYATIKYCQLSGTVSADTSICVGDTVMLNATGGISYSWSPTAGLDNPNSATPNAFPSTTTIYVVTITNANSCTYVDSVTVVINPLPGPNIYVSGSEQFCFGDSTILFTDTSSAYYWNTGDTTNSIIVYNTGTYTVTVIDTMGCQNSTQKVITVFPLPLVDAGEDDSVCYGKSVQLYGSGADSYIWSPDSSLDNAFIPNPFASPISSTVYYLIGTDTNNCENSDSVSIVVKPIPNKPIISFISPDLISTPAFSYQWWLNGVPINGSTAQNHQPIYNGDYQVEVGDVNGCTNISDIYNLSGIGMDEPARDVEVQVFPNPSNGFFQVRFNNLINQQWQIEVVDQTGKLCFSEYFDSNNTRSGFELDLRDLEVGIYILKMISDHEIIYRKLMVQ